MRTTDCRRCGQRVRLLPRTDTGRRMVLNPTPHELGTVTIVRALGGPMAQAGKYPLGVDPRTQEPIGYLPHWRTCTEPTARPKASRGRHR